MRIAAPVCALTVAASLALAPAAQAAPFPAQSSVDDFSIEGNSLDAQGENFYTTTKNLSDFQPGDVIKTRELTYRALSLPLPLQVTQILYRTTNALGQPDAAVTSVIKPNQPANGRLVSFHSLYDATSPEYGPSRAIAGNLSIGGIVASWETVPILAYLAQGYTVAMPDIEGGTAEFANGPAYGAATLDGIRAVGKVPATGIAADAPVGMTGYSGGSIASAWGAAMAPNYAPDVNARLVGSTAGGLLIDPGKNFDYVSGTPLWAGVIPLTVTGAARAYHMDLDPYLSENGKHILASVQQSSFINSMLTWGGVTWADMAKPEYHDWRSVPPLVAALNKMNLGLGANPTVPMQLVQGTGGYWELSFSTPHGAGDGVMLATDARALAQKWCAAGMPVEYAESPLAHTGTSVVHFADSVKWLTDRFNGVPAPNNCGSIPQGNNFASYEAVPPSAPNQPRQPVGSTAASLALRNGAMSS